MRYSDILYNFKIKQNIINLHHEMNSLSFPFQERRREYLFPPTTLEQRFDKALDLYSIGAV